MTEKIYDLDSSVKEFDCKVVCLYEVGGRLAVETDRTAFFPTGGGQTSDRGILGGVNVENVEIQDGHILHFVENSAENVKKLQKNALLHGVIDWNKRFSDMQQHSGEHLLSGTVHRLFGYNNVGFHLSDSGVTVDFDGVFTENDLRKVEDLVNRAIWDDLEIRVSYPDEATLAQLVYRSKKEIDGPLRIVEIPGVDVCACCAPHVKRTGEIGAFRILHTERNRGGTRLWMLCGERLLRDSREKLENNAAIGRLLSCRQYETAQFTEKLKAEKEALSYQLVGLQRELVTLRAAQATPQTRIVERLDGDAELLRLSADLLAEKATAFAAVYSQTQPHRFVLISKTGYDLEPLCQTLRSTLGAKCGGRGGIVQGSADVPEETLRAVLEA